jgi:hypothetical protein
MQRKVQGARVDTSAVNDTALAIVRLVQGSLMAGHGAQKLLRQVMVYGASLASLWADLLALVLTIAIGLPLAVRFFRWEPTAS